MTISKYIVDLLAEYEGLEIELNHIPDGADQYGLFKSPAREVKRFNDGSCEISEHYLFYARQTTLSGSERKEADEWLEKLTYWIDDLPFRFVFPPLDGHRTVQELTITGCPYPMEADDKETLYQLTLSITYLREMEDMTCLD